MRSVSPHSETDRMDPKGCAFGEGPGSKAPWWGSGRSPDLLASSDCPGDAPGLRFFRAAGSAMLGREPEGSAMEVQALGYVGIGASDLTDWTDFATNWL